MLACAPSNSAADLLVSCSSSSHAPPPHSSFSFFSSCLHCSCYSPHFILSLSQAERLLVSGHLEQGALIRLNALQRSQPPSAVLLPHCLDVDSADTAAHYRVVVCTCVTAGLLYSLGLSVGHFTHVFVDEAGQATEPECLIPLGLLAGTDRQVWVQVRVQVWVWVRLQVWALVSVHVQ